MLRQMKNRIKEVFKSPGKLIAYIAGIALLLFFVVSSMFVTAPEVAPYYDNGQNHLVDYATIGANYSILIGVFFGFFAITFFTSVLPALKGTSQYGMEDVNFLFVAPIRPRTILLYGIIQSFKTILIGSWFVVFQVTWLRDGFGISTGGVVLLWVGYVFFSLACQIFAIFIYAMTNGNRRKIANAKLVIALSFLPFATMFVINLLATDFSLLESLGLTLDSIVTAITPVVGWGAYGIFALITGEMLGAVVFLGLLIVFTVVLLIIVFVTDPNYYEHVASATETAFEAKRNITEGDVQSVLGASAKNARVKGTGINRGWGASVFLAKHLRESFRTRWLGPWGISTLLFIVGAGIFAFISRGGAYEEGVYIAANADPVVITILSIMLVIGFFSSGMSHGSYELYSHYIYMVPVSPFKKWLWPFGEFFLKNSVEAVLIFGVAAVVFGGGWLNFAVATVVYLTFTFYLLGTVLAFMRITGIASRSILLSVLMMFLYIVPLIPGAFVAIFVGILLAHAGVAGALTAGLVIFAAWQLIVGLACFALSKGMLHDCDMLTMDGIMKSIQ